MNKKKLCTIFLMGLLARSCMSLFADTLTDALQDLAVRTACIGQYSMTEAGGGWYEDPHDYYTPQMMAYRLSKESGNMTRTSTFYGICFDYAQFAFEYIKQYTSYYNSVGMKERQFWVAGVLDNPRQIELMSIGTKTDYTRMQNGVPIKTYSTSLRNAKAHGNATYHAWIWILRADGIWFWVDPTWTDNLGYVVYGYVNNNGQEIQCKPNKDYCVTYPASLNNLPLPPAMGPRQAPSKSANSTNREETIKDAAPDFIGELFKKIFEDVDYKEMDTYAALLISADLPFSVIKNKEIDFDKIGFALEVPILWDVTAAMLGLEYLQNLEEENNIHALLLDFAFVRRLYNNLAWFLGGGFGLRLDFDQSSNYWAQEDWSTGYLALKANTGFIINLSHLFTKIDVSYNNVTGFSVGAGIGLGAIAY